MKLQQITAKLGKGDDAPRVNVNMNMPETIEEAIDLWGADVVLYQAKSAITVAAQAMARRLKAEKVKDEDGNDTDQPKYDDAGIQAQFDADFKPTAGAVRKSKSERVLETAKGMTPEERAALIKMLQEGADEDEDEDEEDAA